MHNVIKVATVKHTHLYAVIAGENVAVKFGQARNVAARMGELQVGNHLPLTLAASIYGPDDLECLAHVYLEAGWLRGEWHALDYRAKALIERMKTGNVALVVRLFQTLVADR